MSEGRQINSERFLALLRPIEQGLEVYARSLLWDAQEVPDALQNALLRAYARFDRYHEDASFRAWMFKILTNEVFTLNRKYARIAKIEYHLEPEEMDALAGLEQAAEYTDWLLDPKRLDQALDQNLAAALKTLTENERAVLLLRGIGDFQYAEIAQALAMPIGSVMGHLARARKKMREALRQSNQRIAP